ncbi:MAG: filamentous hemagglutinin N-terminal domain-containing protein [Verrucomicrobiales bacterium]|nr:filamentous hemagglutinin N-terminal domain-containing protein [Verrucomicrobiales bacterium]
MKTTTNLRNNWFLRSLFTILTIPGLIVLPILPIAVQANPSGASVVAGAISFNGLGTSSLTINQASNMGIINWQNFSIAAGDATRINQPGVNSLSVNRVVSGNLSSIYGSLTSNGGVMLINPNGIIVGPSGMIDVAGALTLSTLDASNQDLLNGGSNRFRGSGDGGVVNYGTVSGRDVIFMGNYIHNHGSVTAARAIAMGVGGDMLVEQTADGATISVRGTGVGGTTGIDNTGNITGGNVQLTGAGNAYTRAINNSGTIRANGYKFRGGKLTLSAGSGSRIVNTGNMYARQESGRGGTIAISGGEVNLESGRVDASGELGHDGGMVEVSATDISVGTDALVIADGVDGGSVNLNASNNLNVAGSVSTKGMLGNGGNVDLAGNEVVVAATAVVDASGFEGGRIRVGGGIQGSQDDIQNSMNTTVSEGALLIADGEAGDGGEVVIWSDGDTMFGGEVSARATGFVGNGGFVEVSGKNWLSFLGFANTSANNGFNGTLLLDPTDVIIGPSGTGLTMTDAALIAAVLTNNVVVSTSGGGAGNGDITVNAGSDIQYDSPNSLTFLAHRHIFINGDVKNHGTTDTAFAGTGNISLVAGWDGNSTGSFSTNISAADILAGDYGSYANGGGSIFLNDAAAEPVEVGSARGETNAFGGLFFLTAGNGGGEFTQFGYRRENDIRGQAISGLGTDGQIGTADDILINTGFDLDFDTGVTGDINVYAEDGVFMIQHQGTNNDEGVKNVDRTYVMIGHGGLRENDNDVERRGYQENLALGFTGTDLDGAAGTGDFGSDTGNLTVGNGDNHGNITVQSGGVIYMQAARAEGHAQIGHGGLANDDPDHDPGDAVTDPVNGVGSDGRGFFAVSDRGRNSDNNFRSLYVFGNMTGDIDITANSIDMEGGRYNDAFVMIGHGGVRISGEHAGDITVTTTGGGIRARAVPDSATGGPANSNDWRWNNNRDQSFAQIGHGGFASDFVFLDTLGGFNPSDVGRAAADALDAYDTVGNTAEPDDPNGIFMDANPNRTVILNNSDGPTDSVANTSFAGDGIAINRVRGTYSDTAAYTVNGVVGGVTNRSFGHSGDITINSAGNVRFEAANGTDSYAMVGHGGRSSHGDHLGDIVVNAAGSVIFTRDAFQTSEVGRDITNRGQRAHVQIGHGGGRYVGGATGDITVIAGGGNIEFYGGRAESFAQIGHGGRGEDGSTWNGGRQRNGFANGTHSGDITVASTGDIKFRSGFTDSQSHSQIGHGGYYQFADVLLTNDLARLGETPFGGGASAPDQVGHNGDILVTSGGDISFIAGQTETLNGQRYMEMNGNDNYTMIGHGGRNSKGDHWGNVDINAAGDLDIEARGGWDAVTIENNGGDNNTNQFGTPRLGSTEDNGRTGIRNFGMIGHGGYDSEHVNTNSTQNWNNSGKNGDGIGVLGASDISINLGGDLIALGAMKATTIDKLMPIRVIRTAPGSNEGTQYTDEAGNVITTTVDLTTGNAEVLPEGYSEFNGRLETITRDDGEVWDMPDPVLSAEDGWVKIGNGGRSTDYIGSGGARNGAGTSSNIIDGLGHRGDVSINAGGDIRVEAGDFKQSVSTGQAVEINVTNFQGNAANAAQSGTIGGAGIYYVGPASGANADAINGDDSQNDASAGIRNFAQIGLGGSEARGDHVGRVTIVGGGDLDLIAGEGNRAFAQIGSGGMDADRLNNDGQRANDIGMTSYIDITIDGKLTMKGGGLQDGDTVGFVDDVTPFNSLDNGNAEGSYVQIGSGGRSTGGDHHADINIQAGTGVEVEAGNSPRGAYGQIGSGGYWGRSKAITGDISVVTLAGDIDLKAGIPVLDTLDDGYAPANLGNMTSGRANYAQIGNGGFNTDAESGTQNNNVGNGGFSGDIEVIAATGSINITGGGSDTINQDSDDRYRGMYSMIGHGGSFSDGDHTGDIRVSAGVDLTITGGKASREAYAQIGHGGYDTDGDHTGTIDIEVGNDLTMTRGNNRDLNGVLVRNNWSKIGHGAQAFGGRNTDGGGTRTGDIFVSVGNNLTMADGLNIIQVADEDLASIGAGGNLTLVGIDGVGETVRPGSFFVTVTTAGVDEVYVDDGAGQIVLQGTTTVVGTIDYSTGEVTITSDISTGSDTTLADYSTVQTSNGLGALIGHVDTFHTGKGVAVGAEGDTMIAVSRNDPTGGTGTLTVSAGSAITSADGGLTTDLRIYVPSSVQDQIATGAFLNSARYNRDALGGVGNRDGIDEQIGADHTMTTGTYGEPVGTFIEEGDYPFNALGLYNIYFASTEPIVPEEPETPETPEVPPFVLPEGIAEAIDEFRNQASYDTFDWPYGLFEYDGYEGHWGNLGPGEAVEGAYVPRSGLEVMLDAAFGPRQGGMAGSDGSAAGTVGEDGTFTPGSPSDAALERVEDNERLRNRALGQVGKGNNAFYLYEPGTNIYSSLRLFGVPASDVPSF